MATGQEKFAKRQPNFTTMELQAMTQSIGGKAKVLFGRLGGVMSVVSKEAAWKEVASDVSAVSGVRRSAADVKKKWIQVKSNAKGKAVALRRERGKTGGGKSGAEDLSECDSAVIGLIAEASISGVAGGFDVNSSLMEIIIGGRHTASIYMNLIT